jgi:thiosulfate dehydrogenase [quinone] large subunit
MATTMRMAGTAARTASIETFPVAGETTRQRYLRYVLAAIRLSLGWVFLWAFLDKTFGLGHETTTAQAWINGGSPTKGFLANAATGPFTDFYHNIAGTAWANWMFMVGLLGIGLSLILGVFMRIACTAGAAMLVMMWTVVLPPENNVFMDDHLIYAMVLIALALAGAGMTFGLGKYWERISLVSKYGALK